MKTDYIVGTRHEYQAGILFESGRLKMFEQMLHDTIGQHQILGIGEEMCLGALRNRGVENSIPFRVCQQLDLPHRYCDADTETKAKRGITNDSQREEYWLEQLNEFTVFPILFICGAMHSKTFYQRLRDAGLNPEILFTNWPHPLRPNTTPP